MQARGGNEAGARGERVRSAGEARQERGGSEAGARQDEIFYVFIRL